MTLRARWLGTVAYRDAHALQRGIFDHAGDDYLLLLEHPHVYTLGVRADPANVLVDPSSVGADLLRTDRGGDVTYHGPGQLVGYPIVSVPMAPNSMPCYVHSVEQLIIDTLRDLGLTTAHRSSGYPGVWIGERKICAIGVKVTRGRSMHGFALNVRPDLSMFEHIVPCGLRDKGVTSLAAEGVDVSMREVVDVVTSKAAALWGAGVVDRAEVAWKVTASDMAAFTRDGGGRLLVRLNAAGVDSSTAVSISERKPDWLRVKAQMGAEYRELKKTIRDLDLVTVCEEAGCPNIFECWADRTATFMINGERCTRACGFCLVDTRKPLALDASEPEHVAEAVERMGLSHAVVTAVARDDLTDGGAAAFAGTIHAIRRRSPGCDVEVLIPDCKGDDASLQTIFQARPDVLNHNLETVARLQRAVRPSASYARSLSVLARAKAAGLTTKSGIIVGMGENDDEVHSAMVDLRSVGVDILTVGQYLRPTAAHLPVDRWVTPEQFASFERFALEIGFRSVEASPLARSSYHARGVAAAART